jgi:hypothetical protein
MRGSTGGVSVEASTKTAAAAAARHVDQRMLKGTEVGSWRNQSLPKISQVIDRDRIMDGVMRTTIKSK